MYNGKHTKKPQFKSKKSLTLLVALLMIFTVSVGSTLAFLITQTDPVVNTFTPGKIEGTVNEEFEEHNYEKKENVSISINENSDVSAYVRALVVISWQDEAGNVYGQKPVAGVDYTITMGTSSNWFEGANGYYYYSEPLGADLDTTTDVLIKSCTQKQACENPKYKLNVDVIAEAIQAEPVDAVKEAWGVTVNNDGTISK